MSLINMEKKFKSAINLNCIKESNNEKILKFFGYNGGRKRSLSEHVINEIVDKDFQCYKKVNINLSSNEPTFFFFTKPFQ